MTRRTVPAAAVVALIIATVALTFLPWVGIGQSRRSSYRLLSDLDTLGVLHGPLAGGARVVWVCQPALASLAVLLAVLGWRRLGGLVAAMVFVIAGTGSVVVLQAPVEALLGARLALPTALLGLAGLALVMRPSVLGRFQTPEPAEPPG